MVDGELEEAAETLEEGISRIHIQPWRVEGVKWEEGEDDKGMLEVGRGLGPSPKEIPVQDECVVVYVPMNTKKLFAHFYICKIRNMGPGAED